MKTPRLSVIFTILLSSYSILITTLYVVSTLHYREKVDYLRGELKDFHKALLKETSKANIKELERKREQALKEIRSIKEMEEE